MKIDQAIKVLNLKAPISPETTKAIYKKACMKYHPDKGGSLEMMQAINQAYKVLRDYTQEEKSETESSVDFGEALNNAINLALSLGLNVELCGTWLWVSGDTKEVKESLKEMKFKWARNKKMWFFREESEKSFNRKKMSIDEIRQRHGSKTIKGAGFNRLSA